jgi:hypothetical protein
VAAVEEGHRLLGQHLAVVVEAVAHQSVGLHLARPLEAVVVAAGRT